MRPLNLPAALMLGLAYAYAALHVLYHLTRFVLHLAVPV